MANEPNRNPQQQPRNDAPVPANDNVSPAWPRLRGLMLLAGQGAFPHGSTSLMVGEHISTLDISGVVREIVKAPDGTAWIGVGPSDVTKGEKIVDWLLYNGPYLSRVLKPRAP